MEVRSNSIVIDSTEILLEIVISVDFIHNGDLRIYHDKGGFRKNLYVPLAGDSKELLSIFRKIVPNKVHYLNNYLEGLVFKQKS